MKPNKRNRLFSPLRTACTATLLLCQPVFAGVWTNVDTGGVPDLNAQICMADAYVLAGGKGMANTLGESLNCTANDVAITNVKPLETNGKPIECELGKTFQFRADITVKSNASERWDTTFYLPLNDKSPQVIQGLSAKSCSILLPKPNEEGAADLDGDQCGDIKKSLLSGGQYVLEDEPITMICEDKDEDGQADFHYCAAWDNQSRNNCTVAADPVVGQVPNTKSKCNCATFNIPVIIKPEPPVVTKILLPETSDVASEPEGIFKYLLTVTRDATNKADVIITALEDVVRSSTDTSVYGAFNLHSSSDQVSGNLTLLGSDEDYTCDDLTLPATLSTTSPSLSCVLVMKVSDEDLPDDATNAKTAELYQDFVRVSAKNFREEPVGNDKCDLTDNDDTNDEGNCSQVVTVKIENVDPVLEITKTPVKGPGLRQVSNVWYVDKEGLITYEITITNKSPVDAVLLTELKDTAIADLLTDNSGSPACIDAAGITLTKGESFTCQYVADVKVEQNATYTNTVAVKGKDNEERAASDEAMASVTRATPKLSLNKEVAAVNGGVLDAISDFSEEANVAEPGGLVVYRFTITNENSKTKELLTLTALMDDVLPNSERAKLAATQRTDECDFTVDVLYDTPYVCTLVAEVSGNATDVSDTTDDDRTLVNTASVKATAPNGASVTSNEDTAKVVFTDVPPTMDDAFALKASVFIKVKNTSHEPIYLKTLKVLDTAVADGTTASTKDNVAFIIRNPAGGVNAFSTSASGPCPEPPYTLVLAVDEDFECSFSVEFTDVTPNSPLDGFTANGFPVFSGEIAKSVQKQVEIVFNDEEGTTVEEDAGTTITTLPSN